MQHGEEETDDTWNLFVEIPKRNTNRNIKDASTFRSIFSTRFEVILILVRKVGGGSTHNKPSGMRFRV